MEEVKTNIINFPKLSMVPLTKEEVDDTMDEVKSYHINEAMDYLFDGLIEQIGMLGFPLNNSDDNGSVFMHEVIRAYLYRLHGLEHPMSNVIDGVTRDDPVLGRILDLNLIKIRKPKKED